MRWRKRGTDFVRFVGHRVTIIVPCALRSIAAMRCVTLILALLLGGAAAKGPPADTGGGCAATLRAGCLRLQATCRMACPGLWSTNPRAPAFTPTDRAGCTARCQQRYTACIAAIACR